MHLIMNSRSSCAVHKHKLCVFISIIWQGLRTASRVRAKKQWYRHRDRRRRVCNSNNVTVISRAVVCLVVVCKYRQLQPRIVRRLVGYPLFFYNATDAKRARPDRDGCGLAGRSTRLFRLEINTAVDAPLLRRSLLK